MPSPRCWTQKSSPLIPSASGLRVPRVGEELVGDVPLPDLPAEVRHLVDDVLPEQIAELCVADRAVADTLREPARQLVVPDERVTADELIVLLREPYESVAAGPVVGAAGRLDSLPLHLVAGRDRRELISRDLRVVGMVEVERNDRGADPKTDRRRERSQRIRRPVARVAAVGSCDAAGNREDRCDACSNRAECADSGTAVLLEERFRSSHVSPFSCRIADKCATCDPGAARGCSFDRPHSLQSISITISKWRWVDDCHAAPASP